MGSTTYAPNYELSKIYLYHQYKGDERLENFVKSFNSYINDMMKEFFEVFALNLDLRRDDAAQTYSTFYLEKYFGLEQIPNPTSKGRSQTTKVYDDTDDYDRKLRYDELVGGEGEDSVSGNLPASVWSKICGFMLDYSYPVYNIEALKELLCVFYKAFEGEELDFNAQVQFLQAPIALLGEQKRFCVVLPKSQTWDTFRLISLYKPNLLGLPYGFAVEIVLFELSIRLNPSGRIDEDIGKVLEIEVQYNGDDLEVTTKDPSKVVVTRKEGDVESDPTPFGVKSRKYVLEFISFGETDLVLRTESDRVGLDTKKLERLSSLETLDENPIKVLPTTFSTSGIEKVLKRGEDAPNDPIAEVVAFSVSWVGDALDYKLLDTTGKVELKLDGDIEESTDPKSGIVTKTQKFILDINDEIATTMEFSTSFNMVRVDGSTLRVERTKKEIAINATVEPLPEVPTDTENQP